MIAALIAIMIPPVEMAVLFMTILAARRIAVVTVLSKIAIFHSVVVGVGDALQVIAAMLPVITIPLVVVPLVVIPLIMFPSFFAAIYVCVMPLIIAVLKLFRIGGIRGFGDVAIVTIHPLSVHTAGISFIALEPGYLARRQLPGSGVAILGCRALHTVNRQIVIGCGLG